MNQVYHFIGIGGSGMGPLASMMLTKGARVRGSDVKESEVTRSLKQQGAEILIGHEEDNIGDAEIVIYSSAIKDSNPELKKARALKLKILKRAELLAELMKEKKSVAVAGAHGKTTTSSMISHLLSNAGLSPTTMIGGYLPGNSYNALVGDGEYFVAEVDESDGSFLLSAPMYAVITNIDAEHMDFYKNWDNLLEAYRGFIQRVSPEGAVFVCGDDKELKNVAKESGRKVVTFGLSEENDVYAKNVEFDDFSARFDYFIDGTKCGDMVLSVPGKHNVSNALGCIAVANCLGVEKGSIRKALSGFQNVRRRFQLKGKVNDILVVDDYGHHPTEIEATILTAQNLKRNRLITVFQPHRFSRTQLLMKELVQSLSNSEFLIVTDIYEASEKPIEGVSTQVMFEQIKQKHTGHVVYLPKNTICRYLVEFLKSGDVVLTMGAGDINQVGEELLAQLKSHTGTRS